MPGAFWQAASSCIVPMTLISFWETRPPADSGVAMTFMCTTVSTSAWAMILPIIGLRMSARTNSAPPMSCGGGMTSTPMTRVDAGLGGEQPGEAATEVAGDTGHEDGRRHESPPSVAAGARGCHRSPVRS